MNKILEINSFIFSKNKLIALAIRRGGGVGTKIDGVVPPGLWARLKIRRLHV